MNPKECIYVLLIIGLALVIKRIGDLFFEIGQCDLRWVSPGSKKFGVAASKSTSLLLIWLGERQYMGRAALGGKLAS
jgi:hypothetical protein